MNKNIPSHARPVRFIYGKYKGTFYVWETPTGKWQWDALGNNGEEGGMNEAINAAKDWIISDRIKH